MTSNRDLQSHCYRVPPQHDVQRLTSLAAAPVPTCTGLCTLWATSSARWARCCLGTSATSTVRTREREAAGLMCPLGFGRGGACTSVRPKSNS